MGPSPQGGEGVLKKGFDPLAEVCRQLCLRPPSRVDRMVPSFCLAFVQWRGLTERGDCSFIKGRVKLPGDFMIKRSAIGSSTLAAAINRFRRANNHPNANAAIVKLVDDISRYFTEEERLEFVRLCTRNLNDPSHQQ